MRSGALLVHALGATYVRQTINSQVGWVNTSATPAMLPLQDGFYNYSGSLDGVSNGEVLQWREVGLSNYTGVSSAYQLLYRTESALGDPEYSVTTVIVPSNNNNQSVVSYQIPEDASYLNCAPSYETVAQTADTGLQDLITAGHVVVSPDYEGTNSTFAAGVHEGKLTLDSLRAYLSTRENVTHLPNKDLALWGYSGGSIASGWAAELQSSYAPDVQVIGAVVGGFVTNLTATLESVNRGPFVGFVPPGIFGLASAYPRLWDTLNEQLMPQNGSKLLQSLRQCVTNDIAEFYQQDVFSYFRDGIGLLYESYPAEILRNNTLGVFSAPKFPLFVYEGSADVIAVPNEAERAVSYYCSQGTPVQYVKVNGADHMVTQASMRPGVLDFLAQLFRGNTPQGCFNTSGNITQILSSLNSSNTGTNGTDGSNGTNSSSVGTPNGTISSDVRTGSRLTSSATNTGAASAATSAMTSPSSTAVPSATRNGAAHPLVSVGVFAGLAACLL